MKQENAMEQALAAKAPAMGQPGAARPDGAQDDEFAAVVNELCGLMKSGEMPEGFDLQTACADSAFAELMQRYGAEAAVRVYDAEQRAKRAEESAMQRVSERVQQRKGLPRSASGGAFASARPDYAGMDSATFKRMALEMKRNAQRGKKVPL